MLKLYLDSRPISVELENFITALGALTDQLFVEVSDRQTSESVAPCVKVCLEDGTDTGLAFHGVPSGHEFTSFVLGLYNAAGPGQPLDRDTKRRIAALKTPTDLKILVTLSCTMCPELVAAAQRIAAENPNVTAHVYDLRHFEELKDRYKVMSVPCMVINNEKVSFGKKNVEQVLELLSAQTG
jgi:thioredoxin reductase (NADPH)